MLFDIVGRGAEHEPNRRNAPHNQARVLEFSDPKGKIETFLDRSMKPSSQRDVDRDLG
jgi:hypothetical protein